MERGKSTKAAYFVRRGLSQPGWIVIVEMYACSTLGCMPKQPCRAPFRCRLAAPCSLSALHRKKRYLARVQSSSVQPDASIYLKLGMRAHECEPSANRIEHSGTLSAPRVTRGDR